MRTRKSWFGAAGFATLAFVITFGFAGMLKARPRRQSASPAAPSFEVASIKPSRPGSLDHRDNFARGRYIGINVTTKTLILRAFGISDYQLYGAPDWANSDGYDIEAKVEDSLASSMQKLTASQRTDQIRLIFQAMLVDRFKLKVGHETRELPIFGLMVAKNGPKFMPTRLPVAGSVGAASTGQQGDRGTNVTSHGLDFTAVATGVALTQLAAILAREPEIGGRVVVDQTGLTGDYDFTLRWTRENLTGSGGPSSETSSMDSSGPSIFAALQEQLGLRLESKKGPVDVIVIKHIEKASEN